MKASARRARAAATSERPSPRQGYVVGAATGETGVTSRAPETIVRLIVTVTF